MSNYVLFKADTWLEPNHYHQVRNVTEQHMVVGSACPPHSHILDYLASHGWELVTQVCSPHGLYSGWSCTFYSTFKKVKK